MRKDALHDAPVGEHVAHPGGHAQIVFQHHEFAVLHADEVGAADGHVHVARHVQALHLAAELRAAVDQLAGNDAVFEDPAFVVDVFEEQVQRRDALGEAFFDPCPLRARDDARQQIVGKDALRAFVATIHREGDALVQEAQVGGLLAALYLLAAEGPEKCSSRGP